MPVDGRGLVLGSLFKERIFFYSFFIINNNAKLINGSNEREIFLYYLLHLGLTFDCYYKPCLALVVNLFLLYKFTITVLVRLPKFR